MASDPDEILVVVDEDDEPVDEAARGRVHEETLPHRAVHVLLAAPDGRLWLQKRSEDKRTYPSRWTSSASGHVPASQTTREAARREVREELGVEAPTLTFVGSTFVEDLDVGEREFTHVFAGVCEGDFDPDESEVTRVAAFEPHEVEERLRIAPDAFAKTFQAIWEAAQDGKLETDERVLEI